MSDTCAFNDENKRLLAWIIEECLVYPESDDEKQFANRLLSVITHPKSGCTASLAAQRPWVELTPEEIDWIKNGNEGKLNIIKVTAAKLKEKNT